MHGLGRYLLASIDVWSALIGANGHKEELTKAKVLGGEAHIYADM